MQTIKRRSLKKLLQEYNRLDYVVSEKRAKTIAGVFRSNISKLVHQKLHVGHLLKLREDWCHFWVKTQTQSQNIIMSLQNDLIIVLKFSLWIVDNDQSDEPIRLQWLSQCCATANYVIDTYKCSFSRLMAKNKYN